jgi:hypothetical protein
MRIAFGGFAIAVSLALSALAPASADTPVPGSPRACLADYAALAGLLSAGEDQTNVAFWRDNAMALAQSARAAGAIPANHFEGDNSQFVQDSTAVSDAFIDKRLSAEDLTNRAAKCLIDYPDNKVPARAAANPAPRPAASTTSRAPAPCTVDFNTMLSRRNSDFGCTVRACLADYGAINVLLSDPSDPSKAEPWAARALKLVESGKAVNILPADHFTGDQSRFVKDGTAVVQAINSGALPVETLVERALACDTTFPNGKITLPAGTSAQSAARPAPAPARAPAKPVYKYMKTDADCGAGVLAIATMHNQMATGALILDNDKAKSDRIMARQYAIEEKTHGFFKRVGLVGPNSRYVVTDDKNMEWPEAIEMQARKFTIAMREDPDAITILKEAQACAIEKGFGPIELNFN